MLCASTPLAILTSIYAVMPAFHSIQPQPPRPLCELFRPLARYVRGWKEHAVQRSPDQHEGALGSRFAEQPNNLLLVEFIHRSANDFAAACAELEATRRALPHDVARDRISTAIDRMIALAAIQRLLQPPAGSVMNLGETLCALCRYQAQARFEARCIRVRVQADDVLIDAPHGWALLMIVSELLTNAARHAFVSGAGQVDVGLTSAGGKIRCAVRDDGIGTSRRGAGLGSAIVAALARGANIECKSPQSAVGTTMIMELSIVDSASAPDLHRFTSTN